MGLQIIGGRYKIIRRLAGGGFGMTFLAEDQHLPSNHPCLVKQLKPQATDPKTLEIARRLFDTEAKVLHKLGTHAQIPQLFAFFEEPPLTPPSKGGENHEFYLVQEYIQGHSLSDELKLGKRWSEEETIALVREILEILAFVHEQNVIHRDVNPHNILREENQNKLFLIDFGAVKEITTQMMLTTPGQTALSVIIGTPGYMPSEQANGHPKLSSDVYAVGMIAIQALTGFPPDRLNKDSETAEFLWQDKVSVSSKFAEILNTMVRYDFRERYPSALEALAAINSMPEESGGFFPFSQAETVVAKSGKKRKITLWLKLGILLSLLTSGAVSLYGAKFLYRSQNANEYYHRGRILTSLNRHEDALKLYTIARKIKPDYVEAWNQQGNALYELERYDEALDAYDRTIQINPENPDARLPAWIGRGLVLNKLEQYEEALRSFEIAVRIDSESYKAWQGKGDILFQLQRYEEAIEAYKKTLKINDNVYEAWYNIAQCYHQIKEYKEASKAYEKAVELKPDQAIAWYQLGNILSQLEKYEDAVEAYDKAVRFNQRYIPAWYSRGNALMKWEKPEEALQSYQTALSLEESEENPELLYSIAWSLHQLRRYEEAIDRYNQVISLEPENYQAWYNRGNAFYKLERSSEAIASYNQAVAIKPDHYESWYSRGNVLVTLQRYQEAIASYDRALRYEPDYKAAKEAKKQAEKELEKLTNNN
jgi:tetratricopeptide (TPR) repeat protein